MAAAEPVREAERVADATARIGPDRDRTWIDRQITLRGPLGDDRRARLAEIAEKTPVTRAVRGGTEIRTTVA
jgi:putative redox protein